MEKTFNYENLLHNYSVIKAVIIKFDNLVGLLVFAALMYNSCDLYFELYVALDPSMFKDPILIYYNFLASFASFMIMMASASSVAEASSEVSARALTMPEDKEKSNFNHQRFMTLAEKEITLTAWKITPTRRNFIFGIMGILLTYTLMFQKLDT
ncbi:uncharacterized protein TNCT_87811 [Trichonephila clavata]|uniref:Uncharacterized protein n=1 Tax=Trichonephila clavata TaxID=2740835 RepID=A0A8X6KVL9_TRICU|nr:uncharacterized protein TNCT_87811 [Trichonephila clavata]